ncbi:hypothetical protein MAR_023395 [Mya arenaria]|uniref:Uncharacterized protein n=1 Tax=Mya arenaria TaxID=6604 RepID=A0ABY7DMV9_MYAAR|nr:hypothetical protein MAR_023395 [Mya arenaria]
MTDLQNKHKRPKNIENLEVTKVDEILWNQLKPETKAYALVPVVGLMQTTKTDCNKENKELVGDVFKILAQRVVSSNENRRQKIKKQFTTGIQKLCDNPHSAAMLFGDKLEEDIKKMKETKAKLTPNQPNKPFIEKRTGAPINNRKFTAYPPRNNQAQMNYQRQTPTTKVHKNKPKIISVSKDINVRFAAQLKTFELEKPRIISIIPKKDGRKYRRKNRVCTDSVCANHYKIRSSYMNYIHNIDSNFPKDYNDDF